MCYKKFLQFFIFLIASVFPLFGSAENRAGTMEKRLSRFDGVYIGVDGAFASSKSKGVVGPVVVSVPVPGSSDSIPMSAGPFSFGGKDNIPGGAIFAGYGKTFGSLFIAGEIAGGYGSYDNTKAFTSSNFNSDIDVNQGYLGTTARIGFLINPNLLAYYHMGWAHNWIEAEGTVKTLSFSLPNPRGGPPVPASASLNQSVKTDLTFDGLSFGVGFEYALADLTGVEGICFRFGYSRIDYAKERFHYNANGLAGTGLKDISAGGLPLPDDSISIQSGSIPAEADSGVHVMFAGLSYRFRI